ncbi:MAG: MoaD/ThiS family protein [Acidobacteria bacterium]|nr:MoaD/ThiS family protein [Acidobacteriota bacterium]
MRITVRLFARLRELAGTETLAVDLLEPATVADAWRATVAVAPALAPFDRAISCAVNANFSRMSHPVAAGDDVAFLPPVSGG